MTDLDVNSSLTELHCAGNALIELDLSDVPALVQTYKKGTHTSAGDGRERYRLGSSFLEIDSGVSLIGADDTFIEVYFVYKPNVGTDDCDIYAYAFGNNGLENDEFPGVELEGFEVICDAETDHPTVCKAYLIKLDTYYYHHVVFSNGTNSSQTANLAFNTAAGANDYVIYYADSFSTVNTGDDLWPTETELRVEPSCELPGSLTYFGLKTAASRTRTISALGHNYSAGTVHVPTCTEEGWTDYVCSRCGSIDPRNYTDALGHSWGDWTVTTQPTCTAEGVQTRECSACDAAETAPVEALGHSWGEPEYGFASTDGSMTCTASAVCSECGEILTETVPGEYAVVVAPTTEEPGFGTYSFHFEDPRFADQIYNVALEPQEGETVTVYVIDRSDAMDFSGVACSSGGAVYGGNPFTPAGVDKDGNFYYCFTVDVDAYNAGLYFTDCEENGRRFPANDTEFLDPKADAGTKDWVVYGIGVDYTAATERDVWPAPGTVTCEPACEDEGEEEFIGLLTEEPAFIILPALGHAWNEGEVTVPPTTTAPGEKTYTCTRCGATRTEVIPKLPVFEDVPADAWYADAVAWAVENGVTAGMDETHFSPTGTCTRAQVVTFLWAANGKPEPNIQTTPFRDVRNSGAWYYKAVLWAYEKGITNGVSATSFGLNKTCTRAQVVTFLWRAAGSPAPASTENPFTDVSADAWYCQAVLWAFHHDPQITAGTDTETFSPGQSCSRAQAVTFLYGLYNEP